MEPLNKDKAFPSELFHRRFGFRRFGLLSVAGGLWVASCGPVPDTPPPKVTLNQCPLYPCSDYKTDKVAPTCEARGACEIKAPLDPYLVVTVPETSLLSSGATYILRASEASAKGSSKCATGGCLVVPPLVLADGDYIVRPSGVAAVGHELGNGDEITSLPVVATLRPLFVAPGTNKALDARGYGFPVDLYPGVARIPTYPTPPPGPGGGISSEYRASVPPGTYARVAWPVSPFEGSYPPEHRVSTVAASDPPALTFARTEVPGPKTTIAKYSFPLSREGGTLEGFRAELVDDDSGERVSNLVRMRAEDTRATLRVLLARDAPTARRTLRLVPPQWSGPLPELRYALVAGATPNIVYPRVPPPVPVRGRVGLPTSEGEPGVLEGEAIVRFQSRQLVVEGERAASLELRYGAQFKTGPGGTFEGVLPRGVYSIVVLPLDSVNGSSTWVPKQRPWALTTLEAVLVEGGAMEPFVLRPSVKVRGVALAADGRPMVGATVEASPTPPLAAAAWAKTAERTLGESPRSAVAKVEEDGSFEVWVDGEYPMDLTVKPAVGSRFPWRVLPCRYWAGDSVDEGEIRIPAPVSLRYVLRDSNDNGIPRAVVRVMAPLSGLPGVVSLGLALTDERGAFEVDAAEPLAPTP